MRINPSAVPLEKGFGAEAIHYKGTFDFALVQGLGRVGAAISPSNSEETFFGPPGFELPEDHLARKRARDKFQGTKLTLATAFGLIENRKTGLRRFETNLGVMAKHNQATGQTTPGAGISGIAGPFTFGYSAYQDHHRFDEEDFAPLEPPRVDYTVETYSVGLFLNAIAIDYSHLRLLTNDLDTVTLITATIFTPEALFTFGHRTEESHRPGFDFTTEALAATEKKVEHFVGAQADVTRHLMLGVFYNYYLVRELSLGMTVFF